MATMSFSKVEVAIQNISDEELLWSTFATTLSYEEDKEGNLMKLLLNHKKQGGIHSKHGLDVLSRENVGRTTEAGSSGLHGDLRREDGGGAVESRLVAFPSSTFAAGSGPDANSAGVPEEDNNQENAQDDTEEVNKGNNKVALPASLALLPGVPKRPAGASLQCTIPGCPRFSCGERITKIMDKYGPPGLRCEAHNGRRRCSIKRCNHLRAGYVTKQDTHGPPGNRCIRHGVEEVAKGVNEKSDLSLKCSISGCPRFSCGERITKYPDKHGGPGLRCEAHNGKLRCSIVNCNNIRFVYVEHRDMHGPSGHRCVRHQGGVKLEVAKGGRPSNKGRSRVKEELDEGDNKKCDVPQAAAAEPKSSSTSADGRGARLGQAYIKCNVRGCSNASCGMTKRYDSHGSPGCRCDVHKGKSRCCVDMCNNVPSGEIRTRDKFGPPGPRCNKHRHIYGMHGVIKPGAVSASAFGGAGDASTLVRSSRERIHLTIGSPARGRRGACDSSFGGKYALGNGNQQQQLPQFPKRGVGRPPRFPGLLGRRPSPSHSSPPMGHISHSSTTTMGHNSHTSHAPSTMSSSELPLNKNPSMMGQNMGPSRVKSTKWKDKAVVPCSISGCTTGSSSSVKSKDRHGGPGPRCTAHGGGTTCTVPGCFTRPAGHIWTADEFGPEGRRCVRHNGARKCSVLDCTNISQGKLLVENELVHRCARHGGGVRCNVKNCMRTKQGKAVRQDSHGPPGPRCNHHGGGTRCNVIGCNGRSRGVLLSRDSTGPAGRRCAQHGGGGRCEATDCKSFGLGKVTKGDTHGRPGMRCYRHGGRVR